MMTELYALQPFRRHPAVLALVILYLAALAAGCVASRHPTTASPLGRPATSAEMIAALLEPGPVRLQTVAAADWSVPLSGLLNLDHPLAKQAHLEDRDEAIKIYFHVIEHPRFGTYLVDSGVADAFRRPQSNRHLSYVVKTAMNTDGIDVRQTIAEWMRERGSAPAGVFLTHIHLDHIMGLPDLPTGTPVYTGPAETAAHSVANLFSRGTTDSLLDGCGPLREWQFENDPEGMFDGVVDVFDDRTVWALHVPVPRRTRRT
jgi:glyoxylase-like metal-dependent hydrolase (beta-lactamase superfamily II)